MPASSQGCLGGRRSQTIPYVPPGGMAWACDMRRQRCIYLCVCILGSPKFDVLVFLQLLVMTFFCLLGPLGP